MMSWMLEERDRIFNYYKRDYFLGHKQGPVVVTGCPTQTNSMQLITPVLPKYCPGVLDRIVGPLTVLYID